MFEFLKRKNGATRLTELPEILKPEDPVNYNSVLDYMVGLSDKDYKKLTGSAEVYRKANKDVAKIVGVKDEPTHELMPPKPSEEQVDADLDNLLEADDLAGSFLDDDAPEAPKPIKPQAPAKKEKKIDVK